MAAGIVYRLEAIEVHIEQHMYGLFCMRRVHRIVESTLKLATIDQARQRIVRRLIAHLLGQAPDFADVVEHDDGPGDAVARSADWRCRYFDRVFLLTVTADHQRASAHIDAPAHCQTSLHGIT